MIIVGIDPGVEYTGFAISCDGKKTAKTIRADSAIGAERLISIARQVVDSIVEAKATIAVFEDYGFGGGFFNVEVAELVGMIKWRLYEFRLPIEVCFLAPNTVKKVITGSGRATKAQVKKAISTLLETKVSHEADAVALTVVFERYLRGELDVETIRKIKARTYHV